jgi:hypothetical protein
MPGKNIVNRPRQTLDPGFEGFIHSGFGFVAQGLYIMKRENRKTFWIAAFLALWFVANGINNIGNLVKLIREGRSVITLLNPIGVDAKPVAADTVIAKGRP